MKNRRICRLLALALVMMLAASCLAMAEEEALIAEAEATLPEVVGESAPSEGTEAPAEAPEEEIVVTGQIDAPVAFEAGLDLDALEGAPAEVPDETVAAEQAVSDAEAPADAIAEAPAAEQTADDTEEPAEIPDATIAAEQTVTEAEAPMAGILPAAAEAAGEAPAAAPAAEAAVMAEAGSGAPTAVAISASQGNVYYLGMGPSQLNVVLDPAGAQTTLKWKSSKKKVVKVDANGVITPRKAGKAKITVTTGNKKKSSIKVTVLKNKVDGINARPSKALVRSIGRSWTIAPKSVERTAGGKYVCKFYLLNGLGKSKRINNMGLQLYVGGTLVAQKHINRLRVSCGKGSTKVFKVTFGGSDIVDPTPMLLPQYGTSGVLFKLTTAPSLTYAIRR